MENLLSKLEDPFHKMLERNSNGTFVFKLRELLMELTELLQKDEEIKAWFDAIPREYWQRSEDNVYHVAALINEDRIIRYWISKRHTGLNHKNKEGFTPLLVAVEYGNEKVVKILLGAGAIHDNRRYLRNKGPLHLAASRGFIGIVKILISAGADLDVGMEDARTPLHLAISRGHVDVASVLIDSGANVKAIDKDLQTPLHLAALKGADNLVKRLNNMGVDVDALDCHKKTLLYYALEYVNPTTARTLIRYGASTEFWRDSVHSLLLHDAVEHESCEMIDSLFTLGANTAMLEVTKDYICSSPDRDPTTCKNLTCLLGAALLGSHNDVVVKLLNYGADIHAKSGDGYGVLHYAVIDIELSKSYYSYCNSNFQLLKCQNRNELIKTLLLRGAGATFHPDKEYTTFCKSLKFADKETFRLFVAECRIDLSKCNQYFDELIDYISENHEYGHKFLKVLWRDGYFDIHKKNKNGLTALHCSAKAGNILCMKFLIMVGMDVDCRDDLTNETPLYQACQWQRPEAVKSLLGLKSNVNIKNERLLYSVAVMNSLHFFDPTTEAILHSIIKYVVLEEAQNINISDGNRKFICQCVDVNVIYWNCIENVKAMKKRLIYGSISFFDVLVNAEQYYRNKNIMETLKNVNNFTEFEYYQDVLINCHEKMKERSKLIQQSERGFFRIFKDDIRFVVVIPQLIHPYLSNIDLWRIKSI